MSRRLLVTSTLVIGILVCVAIAEDEKSKTEESPIDGPGNRQTTAEAEIRQAAADFATAFDRGDAKAVAAHWTEDGDYVNENGQRFQGRGAIEQEYATFFAVQPGVKIHLSVDSIRLLNADTAIEDGRATIGPLPQGPPAHSRYTAVHVKRDGRWLMSTVRDSRVELTSNHHQLADLEFLIGTWQAENNGSHVEATCRWMANKNFIERTHTVREAGQAVASSMQIIGWDPLQQRVVSWTFASDGGHAVGAWTPHGTGWSVETVGVLRDGTYSAAVNILSHVDENAVSWKSVDRTKGGFRLPDMEEIVLKRR